MSQIHASMDFFIPCEYETVLASINEEKHASMKFYFMRVCIRFHASFTPDLHHASFVSHLGKVAIVSLCANDTLSLIE